MRLGNIALERDRLPICTLRFVQPVLFPQRVAEVGKRLGKMRPQRNRGTERLFGKLEPAKIEENISQSIVGTSKTRLKRNRLSAGCLCLIQSALRLECHCQVGVGLGIVLVQKNRVTQILLSVFEPAEATENFSQIVVGVRKSRAGGDGLAVRHLRIGEPGLVFVHESQVGTALCPTWSELDGLPQCALGFVQLADFAKCISQIVESVGVVRLEGDGPPIGRYRIFEALQPGKRGPTVVVNFRDAGIERNNAVI